MTSRIEEIKKTGSWTTRDPKLNQELIASSVKNAFGAFFGGAQRKQRSLGGVPPSMGGPRPKYIPNTAVLEGEYDPHGVGENDLEDMRTKYASELATQKDGTPVRMTTQYDAERDSGRTKIQLLEGQADLSQQIPQQTPQQDQQAPRSLTESTDGLEKIHYYTPEYEKKIHPDDVVPQMPDGEQQGTLPSYAPKKPQMYFTPLQGEMPEEPMSVNQKIEKKRAEAAEKERIRIEDSDEYARDLHGNKILVENIKRTGHLPKGTETKIVNGRKVHFVGGQENSEFQNKYPNEVFQKNGVKSISKLGNKEKAKLDDVSKKYSSGALDLKGASKELGLGKDAGREFQQIARYQARLNGDGGTASYDEAKAVQEFQPDGMVDSVYGDALRALSASGQKVTKASVDQQIARPHAIRRSTSALTQQAQTLRDRSARIDEAERNNPDAPWIADAKRKLDRDLRSYHKANDLFEKAARSDKISTSKLEKLAKDYETGNLEASREIEDDVRFSETMSAIAENRRTAQESARGDLDYLRDQYSEGNLEEAAIMSIGNKYGLSATQLYQLGKLADGYNNDDLSDKDIGNIKDQRLLAAIQDLLGI